MGTAVDRLILKASEQLTVLQAQMPEWLSTYAAGSELVQMLRRRNGFYAFDNALHVFPITSDSGSGIAGWNDPLLWRNEYGDLTEGLIFFAEDIFQDQFCISKNRGGVFRFYSETATTSFMADTIESWAEIILSDESKETGSSFVREWETKKGPLPRGRRLMPKIPFFMGGEYAIENLWAGTVLEGMRLKGDLARQTRDLPDGSKVKLNYRPSPESEG